MGTSIKLHKTLLILSRVSHSSFCTGLKGRNNAKAGKDVISLVMCSQICEKMLVWKVQSWNMKFRAPFKFTPSLWYFQLSFEKRTWSCLSLSTLNKALSEKNRKNLTNSFPTLDWRTLLQTEKFKNHLFFVLKTLFPKRPPPTTLTFIYFWHNSGVVLSSDTAASSVTTPGDIFLTQTHLKEHSSNFLLLLEFSDWFSFTINYSGYQAFLQIKTNVGFEAF